MQEQIISFATAKLANEKGFYLIQRYSSIARLYKSDGSGAYPVNGGWMYPGLDKGYISAPTQHFLQKWLRETHQIILWVAPIKVSAADKSGFRYSWIISYGDDDRMDETPLGYLEYEEALEEGLKEALKLIK